MQELEERIQSEGTVKAGNVLKVDAFLNHQCDVRLFDRMGSAWAAHFAGKHITKILTIEASGIGIACVAAQHFRQCAGGVRQERRSPSILTATSTRPPCIPSPSRRSSR